MVLGVGQGEAAAGEDSKRGSPLCRMLFYLDDLPVLFPYDRSVPVPLEAAR